MGGRVPQLTQWPCVRPLKGMGSIKLYLACDSPNDENKQPHHTGLVTAQVNKVYILGRRCQACYWFISEDSWKKQHHHRHMEHKDTKNCRETPGTNTQNRQVQMEYPCTLWNEMEELWQRNNRGRTQGFLQWKEDKHEHDVGFLVHEDFINTVMGCRPLFQRAHQYLPEGSPININFINNISINGNISTHMTQCTNSLS